MKKNKKGKKFDIANNIMKTKGWILILSVIGGTYLIFSGLNVPLMLMLGITIFFFAFDYMIWNVFLHSMRRKKFKRWIDVVEKLKNQNAEKNKKKIEVRLIISALLILVSSLAFSYFNPLYVQIFITCIVLYMLYYYFAYSATELSIIIPDVIKEIK